MKKLELLGLQPDGENLTLNDAEGNRYILPVTDDLRAALRKDRTPQVIAAEPNQQMTPREIQALIRAGRTIDEVSDLSALPPSRISALAGPIEAERAYTARLARRFPVGADAGGFTVEELVTSRLVSRDVDPEAITWDATRTHGQPWMLYARFVSGGIAREAMWKIDLDHQQIKALNDEASWLSETSLTADAGPCRPANTPHIDADVASVENSAAAQAVAPSEHPSAPGAETGGNVRVSATVSEVLASLDSQRGKARPMPDADNDIDPEGFDGAHPAPEQIASWPEEEDPEPATILPFRPRMEQIPGQRALLEPEELPSLDLDETPDEAGAPASDEAGIKVSEPEPIITDERPEASKQPSRKQAQSPAAETSKTAAAADSAAPHPKASAPRRGGRRKNRPAMPSWDEIVFGKKD